MEIRPRRRSRKVGPLRLNWAGPQLVSITMPVALWNVTLWKRRRS